MPIVKLWPSSKVQIDKRGTELALTNAADVEVAFIDQPDMNFGIATGSASGVTVLDIDGEEGRASLQQLCSQYGDLPETLQVMTPNGRHYYFDTDAHDVATSISKLGTGIDVRGNRAYAVGPHSQHPSGAYYRFAPGMNANTAIAKAPPWLLKLVCKPRRTASKSGGKRSNNLPDRLAVEAEKVRSAPLGRRNDQLNRSAFSLGKSLGGDAQRRSEAEAVLSGSALAAGLTPAETAATIESGLTAGMEQADQQPFDEHALTLAPLGETDADNARRFCQRWDDRVRYVPGLGWMSYDGQRWCEDGLRARYQLATEAAELIAAEANHLQAGESQTGRLRFCERSQNAGAVERMLTMAQPELSVLSSVFDSNHFLLNTPSGTVDLRSGTLQPHAAADMITKVTTVEFEPTAKCPQFRRFLQRISGGDEDYIEFLQRSVGYSLCGATSEQVFYFVHGPGGNGKSTFVNLIRDMLGEYGLHTPTETLLVKQYDNAIPADLARLKGARMVTAAEANFGRSIDEAKIKAMTGGEPIAARHLRQNYFEFKPEFKLWMMANDFPRVRGTADAFWRRVRVLPFEVEIPEEEQDDKLSDKLKAELPGILAWAVRGSVAWQQKGLGTCAAVQRGTDRWRGFADHVSRFIEEECNLTPGAVTPSAVLLARYKPWCERHGEKALSASGLKTKLTELDLTFKRTKDGSQWVGIGLKT